MPAKTFQLSIVDGHPLIGENGNILLIDTGAPESIRTHHTLKFMATDFPARQAYGPLSIPGLIDLN